MLGKDHPARHAAHLMAGPPDALQAGGDAGRRLDLHHEVDRAHVDPELQRARRDDGGKLAPLEAVLDLLALLLREAPVVGEGDLFARHLVDGRRQPLRQPPRVDEDHRRAIRPDELDQPRMDRRPDRAPPSLFWRSGRRLDLAEPPQVLDRHLDAEIELFLAARVDDLDRPRTPLAPGRRKLPAPEQPRHLVQRPRSSETKRCAPRFPETSAWISSTMTVSTGRRISRACEVRSR